MKSISHSLTGVLATSLLISSNPLYLAIASIVSLLPDCDTSASTLGRIPPFKYLAQWIEQRYPHRSITHSFLITGIITLVTAPLALVNTLLWQTICLSYFIGWFGDVFTKSGVCAFYPSQARLIIPGNPRLRLSTNSPAEYWLIGLFSFLIIVSFYLNNFGSITNAFNSLLQLPQGAIEQIKEDISNNLITVNVKGYNNITQEKINANYEVVEILTENDILVKNICEGQGTKDKGQRIKSKSLNSSPSNFSPSDSSTSNSALSNSALCTNLYRVGSSQNANIIVSRMKVVKTKKVKQVIKEIRIDEDDIIDYINYKDNGYTYITGNLTIDDAPDLVLPKRADLYNPITLQPLSDDLGFIKINSAPLDYCKKYIGDFVGTGTIIIRAISFAGSG